MQKEAVLHIIDEKLQQLEEAGRKNNVVGNLNFGVHLHLYQHNPHLKTVMQKKKFLTRLIIIDTFIIALMTVGIFGDAFDKIMEQPLKGFVYLFIMSIVAGIFFIYIPMRSLVRQANDVQAEVKKMMLQDLKQQVEALP